PQSITGPIADWVSKPLVIDTLLDTIARTLGLEWLHDDEPAGDAPVAPAPVSGASDGRDDLGALAEIDRSDLQALVEIGHVRGINAKLDEIARRDPGAAAGVAQLRLAVERMDFDAVETLLAGGGR
ncbi:MAG: hybrid sensor histidine kinase/response regulator, partial [Aurantimonas coralicida]